MPTAKESILKWSEVPTRKIKPWNELLQKIILKVTEPFHNSAVTLAQSHHSANLQNLPTSRNPAFQICERKIL